MAAHPRAAALKDKKSSRAAAEREDGSRITNRKGWRVTLLAGVLVGVFDALSTIIQGESPLTFEGRDRSPIMILSSWMSISIIYAVGSWTAWASFARKDWKQSLEYLKTDEFKDGMVRVITVPTVLSVLWFLTRSTVRDIPWYSISVISSVYAVLLLQRVTYRHYKMKHCMTEEQEKAELDRIKNRSRLSTLLDKVFDRGPTSLKMPLVQAALTTFILPSFWAAFVRAIAIWKRVNIPEAVYVTPGATLLVVSIHLWARYRIWGGVGRTIKKGAPLVPLGSVGSTAK